MTKLIAGTRIISPTFDHSGVRPIKTSVLNTLGLCSRAAPTSTR